MYPPGPFPPHGPEPAGVVDLGVRLRDTLYRRDLLIGPVREALAASVSDASRQPHRLAMAASTVQMLLDTWPLGSLIQEAVATWRQGPDGRALAVLARTGEIVAAVMGWPRTVDRRWPMPDCEWFETNAGPAPHEVVLRGPGDGGWATAVALRASTARLDPMDLPEVFRIPGDELVAREEEVMQAIRAGAVAVQLTTPAPYDARTLDTLRAVRKAAPGQRAYERYGVAGLIAPDAPDFEDLLVEPPKGQPGRKVRRTCEGLMLPTLRDDGRVSTVGCLVWDAPYKPTMVIPGALDVLRLLDGSRRITDIASELRTPERTVERVVNQLVEMGAATA